MSIVLVGLPVLQYWRRFHFDRGRRWNVVEHLVLQALAIKGRTAGQLSEESKLPRRVILEVLIRLMRSGWVELKAGAKEVSFHATERGQLLAKEDELPAVTERMARKISFAVDLLTGSIFRRRDLTLLSQQEWIRRTKGYRAIELAPSAQLPTDFGHVSELMGVLFNEDEQLLRVDVDDRLPVQRIALITVRDGVIENFQPRGGAHELRKLIVDVANTAKASDSKSGSPRMLSVSPPIVSATRPERKATIKQEDFIRGGDSHKAHIINLLKRARQFVVIHSTFLDSGKFELLMPEIKAAVNRGCKIDILWGASSIDGGLVSSLKEAQIIDTEIKKSGLAGALEIHRASTKSHSKVLVADDGSGGVTATIGSCNWLYSGFESYEMSLRLRDPYLVGDALFELAELARPSDGQLPELTAKLAQKAKDLQIGPEPNGSAMARIVVGNDHDEYIMEARDKARQKITVISHRLGVTAKPAIIIPMVTAIRKNKVQVSLYYGKTSGPVTHKNAATAQWEFKEQGIELRAVQRPRIHAKMLLWDDDKVVISSLNWLSADTSVTNPRQEIGVYVNSARIAKFLCEEFDRERNWH